MAVSSQPSVTRYWDADNNAWVEAKKIIGNRRVTLGPQASQQWLDAPDHLAMVLARYRAAAALIGDAADVTEIGCGEGIGASLLAKNGRPYTGIDVDVEALAIARETHAHDAHIKFYEQNVAAPPPFKPTDVPRGYAQAIVSLDVIEHIEPRFVTRFMEYIHGSIPPHGVCVIGTPNAAFDHLASPQSAAGHCNTYTHERLHALMRRYFHVVQAFGMQDTSIHLGHPDARHYLLMAGIGPR